MTPEDRIKAVSGFGFSERQAAFLVTVMRHAGVCVPRQYARFAGTAYGQLVNVFFDKLVQDGFAIRCECVHNRARVYHVHHRPLYRAIGEPDSRLRRPVPAARVMERLMLLDGVLEGASQGVRWHVSEAEKAEFFDAILPSFPRERLPHGALPPHSRFRSLSERNRGVSDPRCRPRLAPDPSGGRSRPGSNVHCSVSVVAPMIRRSHRAAQSSATAEYALLRNKRTDDVQPRVTREKARWLTRRDHVRRWAAARMVRTALPRRLPSRTRAGASLRCGRVRASSAVSTLRSLRSPLRCRCRSANTVGCATKSRGVDTPCGRPVAQALIGATHRCDPVPAPS